MRGTGARLRRLLAARTATPSCTTSSARTSSTSTRCSGRRCCRAPATARRPRSTRTASSPSTARRCRSRAARSSPRAPTSTTCSPSTCATTSRRKLGAGVEDIDLNLDDFVARVNSRPGRQATSTSPAAAPASSRERFDGRSCADTPAADPAAAATTFVAAGERSPSCYEDREFAEAVREIMALADRANQYIDQQQAVAAGQGSGAGRRACTRSARTGLEPVPAARRSTSSRCCRSWRAGAEQFLNIAAAHLGRRRHAAARPRDQRRTSTWRRASTRSSSTRCSMTPETAADAAAGHRAAAGAPRAGDRRRSSRTDLDRRLRARSTCASRASSTAELVEGADKLLQLDASISASETPHGVRRHQVGLRPEAARRPADGDGRQPRAAQDEVRHVRGHGARGRPGRQGACFVLSPDSRRRSRA
ncbi:MAG: hypothetical protein MZV70_41770 [Desulfobacterales bacterium]|nr:hypothetical protein [Desulfobacterales bacterium]